MILILKLYNLLYMDYINRSHNILFVIYMILLCRDIIITNISYTNILYNVIPHYNDIMIIL